MAIKQVEVQSRRLQRFSEVLAGSEGFLNYPEDH